MMVGRGLKETLKREGKIEDTKASDINVPDYSVNVQ